MQISRCCAPVLVACALLLGASNPSPAGAVCTASISCGNGTSVSCTGSSSCQASDRNCASGGWRGSVNCGAGPIYCPPCPVVCSLNISCTDGSRIGCSGTYECNHPVNACFVQCDLNDVLCPGGPLLDPLCN
jgi:hypothetical protein